MEKNEHKKMKKEEDLTGRVVTRIAPSPTGAFHIGTARTALFNYLFAKKHNGLFIVRFEDTDRERSERKHKKDTLNILRWLSLHPDTVVQQSDRKRVYRKHIKRLIENGDAYISEEPSKKNPEKTVRVVRYKNRKATVSFTDTLRGRVKMNISDLGNFVIARGIDDPLYNLAVVIDDMEMEVTHILRGDDHIANTPRQIALIEALGGTPAVYTHLPLIHSPKGGKLSKRQDAVSVTEFRKKGYLPETIVNAIALLGWNPKGDEEFFTMDELTNLFKPEHLQKKEAIFSEEKLKWFQKHYVKQMPENGLRGHIVPAIVRRFPIKSRLRPRAVKALLTGARERGLPFSEERNMVAAGEYDFYFTMPSADPETLLPKKINGGKREVTEIIIAGLRETEKLLSGLGPYAEWNAENIKERVWEHAEKNGKNEILWPLRVALSGRERSPAPFEIAWVIGKKETLARIRKAVKALEGIL